MIEQLLKRAREINKKRAVRILFLEPRDRRTRKAIETIKKEQLAEPVFLAAHNGKTTLARTLEQAGMMLQQEKADAVITGATHASALTLQLSFNFVAPKVKRVSGAFLMISPDRKKALLLADCAAQPEPSPEQLAEITLLSADTFGLLTGQKPRIALLSYSTKGSGGGLGPEKVAEAVRLLRKKHPDLALEGEMQADAALSRAVAKFKGAKAQDYNVLIFPCLDAANISYKLVERLAGWHAFGPILQGLSKQVNDLSRGCSAKDIVALAAITVLQVDEQRGRESARQK